MPEGDAARRAALRLDAVLQGQELVTAELRVPRFATVDLTGGVVIGTDTVGKHLLTRVQRGDEQLTVHSHMRMDGRWVTGKASAKPCAGPGHQIRMWLVTDAQQAVGLRLAEVKVVRTRDEQQLVGYLGPDILAADFDVAAAARRIADHDGQLVVTLLNQRIVCGLGTMWAAEFASHIGANPYATNLGLDQLESGLTYVRQEMLTAVAATPRESRSRLVVFERNGQPCRVCGAAIKKGRVGTAPQQRVTYWCPSCQPPTSERGGGSL
jgi:endonuclease-8